MSYKITSSLFIVCMVNSMLGTPPGLWDYVKSGAKATAVAATVVGTVAVIGANSSSKTELPFNVSRYDEIRIRCCDGLHWLGVDQIGTAVATAIKNNRKKLALKQKKKSLTSSSTESDAENRIEFPISINPLPIKKTVDECSLYHDDKSLLYGLLYDIKEHRIASTAHLEECLEIAFDLANQGGMRLMRVVDAFLDFSSRKQPKTRSKVYEILHAGIKTPQLIQFVDEKLRGNGTEDKNAFHAWLEIKTFYRDNFLSELKLCWVENHQLAEHEPYVPVGPTSTETGFVMYGQTT